MKWKKLGKIFAPDGNIDWMKTHAMIPLADYLTGNRYKIYFSSRDSLNRSHLAWVIIDINKPSAIIDCSKEPLLSPGKLGTFDESGVVATSLLNHDGKKYLYYVGINLGVTVPLRNSIGLAISKDNGITFEKISEGPIIDRNYKEPHFTATPEVMYENGLFRMWYLSCVKWELDRGKPKHYYHLKYAESRNGIDWDRQGVVAIDFKNSDEYAIGVPHVIKEDGIYKMWYCYRGEKYRIGYAESRNGINWIRKDEQMEIAVSESGWDSEMIEYPNVFDHRDRRYLLYNGNSYGKTGFGLAVLEKAILENPSGNPSARLTEK
jgi:predicted GH43/DUF377 family glycosyl hydrolase